MNKKMSKNLDLSSDSDDDVYVKGVESDDDSVQPKTKKVKFESQKSGEEKKKQAKKPITKADLSSDSSDSSDDSSSSSSDESEEEKTKPITKKQSKTTKSSSSSSDDSDDSSSDEETIQKRDVTSDSEEESKPKESISFSNLAFNLQSTSNHNEEQNYVKSDIFTSEPVFQLSGAFNEDDEDEDVVADSSELIDTTQGEVVPVPTGEKLSTQHIQQQQLVRYISTLPNPEYNPYAKYAHKHSFLFPLIPLETAKVVIEESNSSTKELLDDTSATALVQNNFRDLGMFGQTFYRKNTPHALKKLAHERVSTGRVNKLRMLIQSIEGRRRRKY